MIKILFTVFSLFISTIVLAQDGTLDIEFGIGGKVVNGFSYFNDICRSITTQTDGKIIQAGYSNNGNNDDFAVIRYNYDGTLDSTFSEDGKVTTAIGSSYDRGFSVATQLDGKIVVAGYYSNGLNDDFGIIRYNSDGTLDITFDNDGIVTKDINSSNDRGTSVAIQTDGKIVVGGFSHNGSNFDYTVLRYNINGTLDSTFNGDGIVTTDIGFSSNVGLSIAIQPDGKIILAGDTNYGSGYDFTIVRYNPNGYLDSTFDGDGIVSTIISSNDDYCYSVAIQNDNKIVVAGYSFNGSNFDCIVVRYNINGALDNDFDSDGIVRTIFGSISADNAYSVAIQPDDKIVVVGSTYIESDLDFAITRYNTDGSLDSTFDFDGKVVLIEIDTLDNIAYSVVIQNDGKILVGGVSHNGNNMDFTVVRFSNPSLPVELTAFTANNLQSEILLNWTTSSELNNMGFEIEKKETTSKSNDWRKLTFINGKGTTTEKNYYSFLDRTLNIGKVYYRLKQIDFNGNFKYSDVVEVDIAPTKFSLEQNYPNPFNPNTNIQFAISSKQFVTLKVYDVLGNEVATLVNEEKPAGSYEMEFDASHLSSGVYYYRLRTGEFVETKKMILLR